MRLALSVSVCDHAIGPEEAPVTLVEYGNYDCSYCRGAVRTVRALRAEFGGGLRVVYRHFPRRTAHSPSQRAAEAAEAAARQGKFWRMHEALLDHCEPVSEAGLLVCAFAVGLDMSLFLSDLREEVHRGRVLCDFKSGVQSGVSSTPTFFLNGRQYDDVADLDSLRVAIREAGGMKREGAPGCLTGIYAGN